MFVNQEYPSSKPPYETRWGGRDLKIPWRTWISRVFVLCVALFFLGVGLTCLLESSCCSNESSAVGSMRTVNASSAIFLERSPKQRFGSLEELGQDNYVDNVLRNGWKQGFFFQVVHRTIQGEHRYWVKPSPMVPDQTGKRFYFTNESGVIYFADRDFEPGFFQTGKLPPELEVIGPR